jgi:hypothetical protein
MRRPSNLGALWAAALIQLHAAGCVYTATGKIKGDGGSSSDGTDPNAADLASPPDFVGWTDLAGIGSPDLAASPDLASGGNCSGTLAVASPDPDILVILDTSGSMQDSPSTGGWTQTKWSVASSGVAQAVVQAQQKRPQTNFGLYTFPSNQDCMVATAPIVAFSSGNAGVISSKITSTMPTGNSPVGPAVAAARDWFKGVFDGRPHTLVLVTDADPNCGSSSTITCTKDTDCPMGQTCMQVPLFGGQCQGNEDNIVTMAITAAAAAGIATYVVGVGSTDTYLPKWALAGGTSTPPSGYYEMPPTNASQMISGIFDQIASCTFVVSPAPASASGLVLVVAGTQVPQDSTHSSGWDYDATSGRVTFYGQPCVALQQSPRPSVAAFTGCP